MSNETYNELWVEAQTLLNDVVQFDSNIQSAKPTKDRKKARNIIAELYVRYIIIGNKLERCYDQMVQPQKRLLVRKMLDATIGRVLELKHEFVEVDLSEYNYYEDILLKLGITPQEAELRVPSYFLREREQVISERKKFMEDILRNLGDLEEKEEPKIMTEAEAIRLIQAHERARQGRIRFQFMKEIREMKDRSTIKLDSEESDEASGIAAAMKIQKIWRGYITRRMVRKRRLEEMLLIGMLQPSQVVTDNARLCEKIEKYRYEKQVEYQTFFHTYTKECKHRIKKEKSALMEENIRIEIRNWINSYFQQTGKIPELPSAESGGSRIMFSRQDSESSRSKSSKSSSKESKRSKKSTKTKKETEREQQSEDEAELGFKPMVSNFLPELVNCNQEYDEVWKNKNETLNPSQGPYLDMIDAEKTQEIEDEVRLVVDQAMRGDIDALQAALDRDKGHKGKRSKKSHKRLRRSGKKNKRKKEKDLTPDRTTESLLEELLTNGIVKLYPQVQISLYKGEKSFASFEQKEQGIDPLPTLGDVRQLVTEYCILPLGNQGIRELSPLARSVLIAGPHGSGKKMLVNAICTELGATLFDITPANLVGKYPGKSGLIMLLHLICKMAKILQPSVIFMDGAEKPFVKKVPKTDKTDPKRLKKDLPKLIKNITNEDRVILIGSSSCPWEGDQKLLYQTYDKIIYIPRPDYGTMSSIWRDLLYKYSSISRQFDISGMAKACDGFTVGSVLATIKGVMTTKRMVQLRVQPLTHGELVNALSTMDPVYREEEDAFLNWYAKTPTCKKKQRVLEWELQKQEEANEKKKKKGKKKT